MLCCSIWGAALINLSALIAQQPARPSGAFEFNRVGPISPTAVIQARMDAAPDFGAVLGYATAIRGAPNWWNGKTTVGNIPSDRLPPGVSGERWSVGDVAYTVRYDSSQ